MQFKVEKLAVLNARTIMYLCRNKSMYLDLCYWVETKLWNENYIRNRCNIYVLYNLFQIKAKLNMIFVE